MRCTRFDRECNRTLTRTVNAIQEFGADETEIRVAAYPLESVTKFELKDPLRTFREQGRVTYTGGYVMPGTTPGSGQTALPDDLEQAAVEQVAFWFQNRDKLGLVRHRPNLGTYQQFAQFDLLPSVKQVLARYERWVL